jgi:virulence factor
LQYFWGEQRSKNGVWSIINAAMIVLREADAIMDKYKIAIVGLGDIALKAYLPVVGQRADVQIEGIMSRRRETDDAVGDQYRIQGRYTDLSELLDRKLDAVFVHTPTETHEPIVTACLDRGIPVYVDKPLAYDIAACQRMVDAAAKRQVLLAVGFNRRFAPMYAEAKAWLDEAGGFDLCIAQKHRTRQQKLSAKETLYDDLIHVVDLLLWLGTGSQELLACLQERDEDGRLQHISGSLAIGQGGGSRATSLFSMNRRAGADLEKLELHGGGRSVEVVNLETAVWRDRGEGEQVRKFGSWESIGIRRGFAGAVDHFLNSLETPELCTIRADRVMETHLLIEQLEQMAGN